MWLTSAVRFENMLVCSKRRLSVVQAESCTVMYASAALRRTGLNSATALLPYLTNQFSNAIFHMKKKHKALVEEEHGIIVAASTASSSAAATRRLALLTNPKQASTGSSILGAFSS